MTNPYPLPRHSRETGTIEGDGRATYGPFDFRVWDAGDVLARVLRLGETAFTVEPIFAEKVGGQPFDHFTVRFATPLVAGDVAIVQSRRIQERSTDVTRGGAVSGAALEREFSVIGTVLQELRRDVNAFDGLGIGGGGIVTISDVVGLVPVLAAKASVSAVQALSASIVSLASRTVIGAGLASVSVASLVTTVTVPIATQAQAEAGILNDVAMTPQRTAQAIAAIGGGGGGTDPADAAMIVRTPILFEKADATTLSRLFFQDGLDQDIRAQKLVSTRIALNSDNDREVSGLHIRTVSEGSALNGPRSATLGASISLFKEGYGTGTAKGGEIDALYIVLRNDGPRVNAVETGGTKSPDRSDGCGILIDAAFFDKTGFVGGIEGVTTVHSGTGAGDTHRVSYQIGCINAATGTDRIDSIAYYAGAATGKNTHGLLLTNFESVGGYFENFIQCGNDGGTIFNIDRTGLVSFGKRRDDGFTLLAKMHMTLQADGSLGWINSGRSVQIMSLDQDGNLNAHGAIGAAGLASTGDVSAAGKIIANNGFRGRMINLTPGAYEFSASQLGNYKRGDIFIGAGGRPRICLADGTQPKFLYTTDS